MRDALNATGRPIVYSISEYGVEKPWTWAQPVANSWRTTGDRQPNWASIANGIATNAPLYPYPVPGAWNDPDMLQVGNGAMTLDETKSHMAIWAMLAAPLQIGTDVSKLSPDVLAVVGNTRLIAVDQDQLGKQAHVAQTSGNVQLWVRALSGGREAFAIYNPGATPAKVKVTLPAGSSNLVDVWTGSQSAPGCVLDISVPVHGTAIYTHSIGSPGGNVSITATTSV